MCFSPANGFMGNLRAVRRTRVFCSVFPHHTACLLRSLFPLFHVFLSMVNRERGADRGDRALTPAVQLRSHLNAPEDSMRVYAVLHAAAVHHRRAGVAVVARRVAAERHNRQMNRIKHGESK